MRKALRNQDEGPGEELSELAGASMMSPMASTAMVNRTHRVVRERAKSMQAKKSRQRSLWVPLMVSGGLLAVLVCAVWSVLEQYDETPTGLPDASKQMLVLLMWCLPVSAALLGAVWMRSAGSKADRGSTR